MFYPPDLGVADGHCACLPLAALSARHKDRLYQSKGLLDHGSRPVS